MSTERIAEQLLMLVQRYIHLRPKLILPEHVLQLRKRMEALKGAGYSSEDKAFFFRILILLSQSHEPLTMGELSSELDVPMSSATRIVDGLVRAGMVERINDSKDRRIVRVGMSQDGRELYETVMAYNRQRIAKLLKNFTAEEQTQLLNLMNKLFDALLDEE